MVYRATEKTEARKATVRQRILDEALKLIYEGGFSAVSISKVAEKSEIATGTMYRYFRKKSELCVELFQINTEIEVAKTAEIISRKISPDDKLVLAIKVFARRAIKGRRLAWSLIAEPLDPLLEKERLRYRMAYVELYIQLIKEGIRSGCYVKQDPEVSAAALVGILAETLVGPLSPANREILDEKRKIKLITAISHFCLRAVGATWETK